MFLQLVTDIISLIFFIKKQKSDPFKDAVDFILWVSKLFKANTDIAQKLVK